MASVDDDLQILESKLNTLKLDYERYFLGSRPRAPLMARQEIQKIVTIWANTPSQNSAIRFKFNSINARYQALKRHWDNTLRQMEAGTYKRDVFKANIRQSARTAAPKSARQKSDAGIGSSQAGAELIDTYLDAAQACGQNVKGLTAQKLQAVVDKQTAALKKQMGCKDVSFRVVVQQGKVKLKASPVGRSPDR